ncbi:hypothetical protein [Streptomyces sp. ISL-100]|uniref:hypothetical protein n=1 Tax=Streptomyces sp. ISL-100 TaxID=2819173 RepID=UPI001BE82325|nr:hypothetical protein [Streptomyces sp. ISL-100]MBT2395251.1 hypothetical protein [Streptomyces sp. ISL-100]
MTDTPPRANASTEPREHVDNGAEVPVRRAELPHGDVEFPPVANGLDYLVSVVEMLESGERQGSPRNLKYALLHLAAGAEVLLKARLQVEHWSLVFSNPGKATKSALEEGTLSSCTPKEARERLTEIVGLSIARRDEEALDQLAKSRNALQHYGLVGAAANARSVESLTARVLHFLMVFLETSLLPQLGDKEVRQASPELERIRSGLHQIESYVTERMRSLAPVLGPARNRTVRCPNCQQWALVPAINDHPLSSAMDELYTVCCEFCSTLSAPREAALRYADSLLEHPMPKALYEAGATRCSVCEQECLVRGASTAAAPDTLVEFCFCCGVVLAVLTKCPRCWSMYEPKDEEHHRCMFDDLWFDTVKK